LNFFFSNFSAPPENTKLTPTEKEHAGLREISLLINPI